MEVKIVLSYERERKAKAVAEAISSDNTNVSSDLTVKTFRRKTRVILLIRCEKNVEDLIATIDALLMSIQITERFFNQDNKLII